MCFYCREGLRQVPCQIPGRKYFNKRFSTEAGESKLKGGNTRTAMIKHPTDNLTLETCDEIPRLVLHATMETYLALKGNMVTEWIWPLLVPGHCLFCFH